MDHRSDSSGKQCETGTGWTEKQRGICNFAGIKAWGTAYVIKSEQFFADFNFVNFAGSDHHSEKL